VGATPERTRDRTGFVVAPVRWPARRDGVAYDVRSLRPYRRHDNWRTWSAPSRARLAAMAGAEGEGAHVGRWAPLFAHLGWNR
jgi:hypothetical protein